jgi:eukaryotic-like serine/threonine-protein kinase
MRPNELVQERYALEERIGRGGMAEVWRAKDERLNRTVALKFLAPGFMDHPEFLVRLFNEAQSVAGISHPHVTRVLDYGTSQHGPYLVMEYVSGGSLSDLTGQPIAPERAVELMRQVAAGPVLPMLSASSTATSSRATSFSPRTAPPSWPISGSLPPRLERI